MSDKMRPGSENAAEEIIKRVKAGTLTMDPAKLAKYIRTECGIEYLVVGCQGALLLDAVNGDLEIKIRAGLAWAGYPEESA